MVVNVKASVVYAEAVVVVYVVGVRVMKFEVENPEYVAMSPTG